MEYFTVLWITALGGIIDGSASAVVYPSYAECEAALAIVSATIAYDHSLECEVTDTASGSIRPRARP